MKKKYRKHQNQSNARAEAIEKVIAQVERNNIKFINLWFTDILGYLKAFTITREELAGACTEGMGFDGSSIEGFTRIDESDMIALPDPTTFQLITWGKDSEPSARIFADIVTPYGEPFEGDPRYVLKRNLSRAQKLGYTFCVGPELEYFYFRNDQTPEVLDSGGYFDLTPRDAAIDLRVQTMRALESMRIQVEYAHHEAAPSQHEIDLRYTDALTMADTVMTYRLVVKEIAQQNGVYATFMPKPIFGENGSGMHTHMSLFKGDKNIFFDAQDKYHLAEVAKRFMAGLLKHAREITSVTNQWVNSYKRLVPGYEAPVYLSWACQNRSDLIRVPMYKPGKENATRIEFRSPDPACNPYLAFSVMLAAGLEGIDKGYKLPSPVEENVYKLTNEERHQKGIDALPGSLIEAIQVTEKSEVVRRALGDHVFNHYVQNKKIEWERYRTQITSYELEKYLPVL